MRPSADEVRQTRYLLLVILRVSSFLLVLFGAVCWLFILVGLPFRDPGPIAIFGAAILIPGVVLPTFSHRIVRWLIPLPDANCPDCGYDLRGNTSKRCPECGLPVARLAPAGDAPHHEAGIEAIERSGTEGNHP